MNNGILHNMLSEFKTSAVVYDAAVLKSPYVIRNMYSGQVFPFGKEAVAGLPVNGALSMHGPCSMPLVFVL